VQKKQAVFQFQRKEDVLQIARIFPRKTNATPDDSLAFTTLPPKILPDIDEVHVSVSFSYDRGKAEQLAEAWAKTGLPVKLGGPAYNTPSGDFVPGLYLRKGYVITSRGCDNNCWFCNVPQREGNLRELPITEGHNVLDDNLLACSENHIRAVFDMLKTQSEKPVFTGGMEAKLLKEWHIDLLREAKTRRMYFAYDTPDDYEPLIYAGKLLRAGGITKASNKIRCYVLIGYPNDTMEKAENRLRDAWAAGFFPYAMLYRDEFGKAKGDWHKFQRQWVRPQSVYHLLKSS